MIAEHDWERLARYLAGECAADEAAEIERWIATDPVRQEALAFMRDLDTASEVSQPQWDTTASWDRLAARQSARVRRPMLVSLAERGRPAAGWRRPALAAAAVVLLAAGAGLWRFWTPSAVGTQTAPVATAMRQHVTPRGQRATFRLPDGTAVVLGVASKLQYPASYGAGRRDVYLEGEAFFEVKHDAARPFLVHTARGVSEDLGTKFSVHEYPGDTTVQVVVAEGSVELRARDANPARRGALLRPGQLGSLTLTGDALVRSGVDLDRYLAWTTGRLVFEDTPLRDALADLTRWYDLDFVLSDPSIGDRRVTATLAGEDLTQSLVLLSSSLDIRFERRGHTITFLPPRRVG